MFGHLLLQKTILVSDWSILDNRGFSLAECPMYCIGDVLALCAREKSVGPSAAVNHSGVNCCFFKRQFCFLIGRFQITVASHWLRVFKTCYVLYQRCPCTVRPREECGAICRSQSQWCQLLLPVLLHRNARHRSHFKGCHAHNPKF